MPTIRTIHLPMLRHPLAIAVAGALVTTAAGAPNPDKADDHTLHLWHLDESAPPFHDSGRSPTMLWGLLNDARAEAPSMDGFLTGVSFVWKPVPAAPGQKP